MITSFSEQPLKFKTYSSIESGYDADTNLVKPDQFVRYRVRLHITFKVYIIPSPQIIWIQWFAQPQRHPGLIWSEKKNKTSNRTTTLSSTFKCGKSLEKSQKLEVTSVFTLAASTRPTFRIWIKACDFTSWRLNQWTLLQSNYTCLATHKGL